MSNQSKAVYGKYVTTEKEKRVLYTEALKAMDGLVDSAFLFWLYLSSHLADHGFVMIPYIMYLDI